MKCIAPAELSISCGKDTVKDKKWCYLHIDKAVKTYKAYKMLEKSLKVDEIDIKAIDIYQLMSLYSKLNKVLELRMVHMKSSISPVYYDKGHEEWRNLLFTLVDNVEAELASRYIHNSTWAEESVSSQSPSIKKGKDNVRHSVVKYNNIKTSVESIKTNRNKRFKDEVNWDFDIANFIKPEIELRRYYASAIKQFRLLYNLSDSKYDTMLTSMFIYISHEIYHSNPVDYLIGVYEIDSFQFHHLVRPDCIYHVIEYMKKGMGNRLDNMFNSIRKSSPSIKRYNMIGLHPTENKLCIFFSTNSVSDIKNEYYSQDYTGNVNIFMNRKLRYNILSATKRVI